ncbi:Drug resistance transporter, EmrB/QacA subfamily [Nostocoides japonicum T1-X7]|uniref:Drug resistance transporter, EmrB/QacA subfamily n=1 Tax=Nostocoides japonicum T1-X7 TaxID=1194083 RepID=A0A077M7Q0_9MICO|nr:MFS transporter [Tetrasphaera japonica]CCH80134.1 Drug resistance transporter, EmrB/QacA subfamily [Tetrasphaera japonica T1-X7]
MPTAPQTSFATTTSDLARPTAETVASAPPTTDETGGRARRPGTRRHAAPPAGIGPGRRGLVLAVVLVTQLMIVLDSAIVNIALPDIQKALDMSSANLSWVVNAYTLAFGGLLLLGARAGDILGRRPTFLAGMALFTAASVAGGLADGTGLLLASRALQGVGAALLAPSALTILMSLFRAGREQTRAIGWYTVVSASGAAVGLIAGGVLTSVASWRWVFFVNVPIGIAVLVLATRVLGRSVRQRGHVDALGAVLVTSGMSALVYGFIRAASHGWNDPATLGAFVLGGLVVASFVAVELRAPAPIVPLRLFADRDRSTVYVARLLLVAGSMGTFFFLSQYMQLVLGWTPWQSGLAFLPIPVTVFLASRVAARATTGRYALRSVAAAGLALSGAGLGLMTTFDEGTTYLQMLPVLLVFGLGNGLAFVPLTAGGLLGVAARDTGIASGLVNVTQQLGGALGLAVLVTVFSTARPPAGAVALATFVEGADRGTAVAAALLLLAVGLVLGVMRRQRPEPSPERQPDSARPDA